VIARGGERLEQQRVTGRVVADTPFGDQHAFCIDQGHVMVVLSPVDAAEHPQGSSSVRVVFPLVRAWTGHAAP
jgi:hypothetical protein